MLSASLIYTFCFTCLSALDMAKACMYDLLSYSVRSFGELSSSRFVIGLFLLLPPCAEAKGPNSGCVSVTGYSVHGTPICDFHI